MVNFKNIDDIAEVKSNDNTAIVLFFTAENLPVCKEAEAHLEDWAKTPSGLIEVHYAKINVSDTRYENAEKWLLKLNVEHVPTIAIIYNEKTTLIEGFDPSSLSKSMVHLYKDAINFELERMIRRGGTVMIFIKGTPEDPKCGFTRTLVGLLREHNISYEYHNILTDPKTREGLKLYSNWPTYPQIYVQSQFIGGLDIFKAMLEDGSWEKLMNSVS